MAGMRVLVTGASGFIGQHIIADLRSHELLVVALVRKKDSIPKYWWDDPKIEIVIADLARDSSQLMTICSGCDAVLHAAASMSGDDEDHARDTILGTSELVEVIAPKCHLILLSSLSVYGLCGLGTFGCLDETTELETKPNLRDAYCRAKLQQERIAQAAATRRGFILSILRPGAVFGPGHLWNGHLGVGVGSTLLRIGSKGEIPLCYVEHLAQIITKITLQKTAVGPLNVIEDNLPSRREFSRWLQTIGWPKFIFSTPYSAIFSIASILACWIPVRRLPGLLRKPVLEARFKPVKYSNGVLRQKINWRPRITVHEALERSARGAVS